MDTNEQPGGERQGSQVWGGVGAGTVAGAGASAPLESGCCILPEHQLCSPAWKPPSLTVAVFVWGFAK